MVNTPINQKILTTSLKEVIGDVAIASTDCALEILKVSQATFYRYRDEVIDLQVPGFEWYFNCKGVDTIALEYLFQYAQLVGILGKTRAKERFKQHMETFWRQHGRT